MKFFLDENMPLRACDLLHELGFETDHVITLNMRGASDERIAGFARENKAVLVTKDIEFGSLLLYPPGSHHGLLILRLPKNYNTDQILLALETFLKKTDPALLVNTVTILEVGKYRTRKLD